MRIFTVLILLLLLFAPKKERACFDISNTMLLKAILPTIPVAYISNRLISKLFDS